MQTDGVTNGWNGWNGWGQVLAYSSRQKSKPDPISLKNAWLAQHSSRHLKVSIYDQYF